MNLKNKLPLIIFIVLVFISMGVFMVYYAGERVKNNLLAEFAGIEAQCNSASGCPAVPEGWLEHACPDFPDLPQVKVCASPQTNSPYRTLVYKASADTFVAWWSYVSDGYVRVSGGRGQKAVLQELPIEK